MEEYNRIKIQHICSNICSGGTPKSTIAEYYGGNIPWLNTKEINFCRIYGTEKTITDKGLNNSSAKWIPTDSVIVAMYGATAGKTAIAKIPLTTNQACCNLTIDSAKADYRFVYYALCNDYAYLASLANGGAQQNLNAQQIKESWCVDFEPFKDGKFVESELGMIPEGCRVGKAEDFYNINIGKTPPRKEQIWFSSNSSDYTWVSISDLGSCGRFVFTSSEFLTHEAIKRHNIILVPKDTILLSFKLTIGRVGIAGTELTTNEAIARFITSDENREYTYFLLKGYNYEKLGSTSSIATAVNSKIIKAMVVLMPDKEILKAFSSLTKPYFDQILRNDQESIRLTILRDTLLPKLMSGELKINATEVL